MSQIGPVDAKKIQSWLDAEWVKWQPKQGLSAQRAHENEGRQRQLADLEQALQDGIFAPAQGDAPKECSECNGIGRNDNVSCYHCEGTGYEPKSEPIDHRDFVPGELLNDALLLIQTANNWVPKAHRTYWEDKAKLKADIEAFNSIPSPQLTQSAGKEVAKCNKPWCNYPPDNPIHHDPMNKDFHAYKPISVPAPQSAGKCHLCDGDGRKFDMPSDQYVRCWNCKGSGIEPAPQPAPTREFCECVSPGKVIYRCCLCGKPPKAGVRIDL